MKVEVTSFRGEVPRLTPRALPGNAAQSAVNPRLLSGDLEAWRQFLFTKTLANPSAVQSIYLLDDKWLSWTADVDAARGAIPGDTTFRLYLTGPDLYTEPRFTNYALATTGAEPFPVATRPLGVPGPDSVPLVALGVDSTPTTFSVDTLDDDASLATSWSVNPPLIGATYATVTQGAGYYLATYDENRNNGQEAYAYRDFGVGAATVLQTAVDFYMTGDTGYLQASMIVGAGSLGDGVGVVYENGVLSIRKPSQWGINFGTAVLGTAAVSPALSANTFYSLHATVVLNSDGTKTVTASIRNSGSAELATLTLTNNFSDGGYCGFANGAIADAGSQFQTRYSNYHVQASGNSGYVPANIATSYVYTFVNDLGEESAPSEPSATVVRPDGVSATVTTPTAVQSGATGYTIQTKRIYRAATGNTGTEFRFVAEIPLGQADYVDVLTDVQLGEVIESTDWDLPPDDLRGILALPNGIMVGFRRNQLCFSAQNHPHAWPVVYRLNTDTDIVGIGNIDTTVVIGTEAFPYLAIGSDPAAYSMTKLEVPQACVSKRSFAYLTGIGVVFASPDGLIAIAGSGQVRNLTETAFTRKQWQALAPETILGVAHDDVNHFWYDTNPAFLSIDDVTGSVYDGSPFTATVTRTGDTTGESSVEWTASGDLFDGTQGFQRSAGYSGTLTFAAGETEKTLAFVLYVTSGTSFDASITLSAPSGALISDDIGTLSAQGVVDPDFGDVVLLLHMDGTDGGTTFVDSGPLGLAVSVLGTSRNESTNALFNTSWDSSGASGARLRINSAAFSIPSNTPWTFEFAAYARSHDNTLQIIGGAEGVATVYWEQSTTGWRFRYAGVTTTVGAASLNAWHRMAATYDGTTLRMFIDGVLLASSTASPIHAGWGITQMYVGTNGNNTPLNGLIDEVRVTSGVARYVADYTVASAAFPNSGP